MTPVVPFLLSRSRTKSEIQPTIGSDANVLNDANHSLWGRLSNEERPTLVRRRTISQIETPRIDYFPSRPLIGSYPITLAEGNVIGPIPFPRSNTLCHQQIAEEDVESDSELEWGVQENMKLFEVSAKDDNGE